jgi:prolipoprotein diacylglyceryl transferase
MLHWYSLLVILGVVVAVVIGRRRWAAHGGAPTDVTDIAVIVIPFGILGGRLYHVITSWQLYFGPGARPVEALYVWQGGLGIWGAVAGGAAGAWLAARRRGIDFRAFADAMAPGLLVGQAIGRIGCWFNQELYGRPTTLPWGLAIDPIHRPPDSLEQPYYHPAFAYEALWDLGLAGVLVWAQRRLGLDRGRVFALYVAGYTAGRGWIEMLRVDPANHILGVRLNVWTSAVLFVAAVAYLIVSRSRPPALNALAPVHASALTRADVGSGVDRQPDTAATGSDANQGGDSGPASPDLTDHRRFEQGRKPHVAQQILEKVRSRRGRSRIGRRGPAASVAGRTRRAAGAGRDVPAVHDADEQRADRWRT